MLTTGCSDALGRKVGLAALQECERLIKGSGDAFGTPSHRDECVGRIRSAMQLRRDRGNLSCVDGPRDHWCAGHGGLARAIQTGDGVPNITRVEIGEQDGRRAKQWARLFVAGHDPRACLTRCLEAGRHTLLECSERGIGTTGAFDHQALRSQPDPRIRPARYQHRGETDRHQSEGQDGADAYHASMALVDDLRSLPKAELHQHLDGSMRPETAVELAAAIELPLTLEQARARMIGPERCRDQAALLEFFDLPIALLQTTEALERVTAELIDDLLADGIRYAEIRWAPRLHTERGLSVRAAIEAVASAVAGRAAVLGPSMPLIGLIVTAMRSHAPAANVALARTAGEIGHPIIGFDLAGDEAAWPAPPHALAFVTAREAGLALTAHAGEVKDPQHVREVLDFGVRRVAHGVTAIEDEPLLQMLRAQDITLDLCPTSNVQAGIVASLGDHPLARLHRSGVSVTLSTDGRTVTRLTLSEEMDRVTGALNLSRAELATIALNAFNRGFAPPALLGPLAAEARVGWAAWQRIPLN